VGAPLTHPPPMHVQSAARAHQRAQINLPIASCDGWLCQGFLACRKTAWPATACTGPSACMRPSDLHAPLVT
jgi:hypothetical protein